MSDRNEELLSELQHLLDNPPYLPVSKWEVRQWIEEIKKIVAELRAA